MYFWKEFKKEIKILQSKGYSIGILGDLNIHLKENEDIVWQDIYEEQENVLIDFLKSTRMQI